MTETESPSPRLGESVPDLESDEKPKQDVDRKDMSGADVRIQQEQKPCLRDPKYSWLNLAILVLAYIDILVSFFLGLVLIVYYTSSENEENSLRAQEVYINNQRIFQVTNQDPSTKSLLLYLTQDAFQREIERAYRTKVFYYGVGISLMATILSPTVVISLGRSKCSYIWIFRSKAVLWVALSLNIIVSLVTIMALSYGFFGTKQFLVILIVPILLLRLVLWYCYVIYGRKCDYEDPRNKFWPYSNYQGDAKDLTLWL